MYTFLLNMLVSTSLIVIIVSIVAIVINTKERRWHSQGIQLLDQWIEAKNRRLEWLKEHSYLPDPLQDEAYQELWLGELGAEEIMNIFTESNGKVSREQYEREKAQQV